MLIINTPYTKYDIARLCPPRSAHNKKHTEFIADLIGRHSRQGRRLRQTCRYISYYVRSVLRIYIIGVEMSGACENRNIISYEYDIYAVGCGHVWYDYDVIYTHIIYDRRRYDSSRCDGFQPAPAVEGVASFISSPPSCPLVLPCLLVSVPLNFHVSTSFHRHNDHLLVPPKNMDVSPSFHGRSSCIWPAGWSVHVLVVLCIQRCMIYTAVQQYSLDVCSSIGHIASEREDCVQHTYCCRWWNAHDTDWLIAYDTAVVYCCNADIMSRIFSSTHIMCCVCCLTLEVFPISTLQQYTNCKIVSNHHSCGTY